MDIQKKNNIVKLVQQTKSFNFNQTFITLQLGEWRKKVRRNLLFEYIPRKLSLSFFFWDVKIVVFRIKGEKLGQAIHYHLLSHFETLNHPSKKWKRMVPWGISSNLFFVSTMKTVLAEKFQHQNMTQQRDFCLGNFGFQKLTTKFSLSFR